MNRYTRNLKTSQTISPLTEIMPFGRFKGRSIPALPDPYLRWLLKQALSPTLRCAAIAEDLARTMALDQWEGR